MRSLAVREGSGTEASYLRAAQAYGAMSADAAAELATLPGLARESSAQVSMQSALTQQVAMALDPPASYSLAVTHYGQQNSYFCGPATGKMILKYLAAGPSKYNGDTQNQTNIGNASHMRTTQNKVTSWSSGLFTIGMNRWVGSKKFVNRATPTPAQFKSALMYNVDQRKPLAADTVELRYDDHYNKHPRDKTIGHWIVGHGYIDRGASTRFSDPATTVWTNVAKTFTHATTSFTNLYLQHNGIAW